MRGRDSYGKEGLYTFTESLSGGLVMMITSLQEAAKVNPLLQREAVANQSRLFFQLLHFCAALLLASNLSHKLSKTLHCQKCHISTYCT